MKSIEVSDDVYAKLVDLANEMTTQDPRSTRMPHMFQIRDWKRQYNWDLNGDTGIWIDRSSDYLEIETFDDLCDYLESCDVLPMSRDELKFFWDNEWDSFDYRDNSMTLFDLIEHYTSLERCSYTLEPVYINCFLTAKAAQEHLDRNDYHYHKNADVYLNHAWRNPEAELVSEFLCGLVNKKMHT
jgi:hypothetical protein